jgi:hypothetical protein
MVKQIGKEARFLNALIEAAKKGRQISRKQAKVNHRLGNPSATVGRLVEDGWNVKRNYTKQKVRLNGKIHVIRTVKYSLV